MAAKKPKKDTAALAADEGVPVPRMSLSENGYTNLRTANGYILEEQQSAFRFPRFFRTIDEMRKTAIIASALNAYKMLLSRVKWQVEAPVGASEKDKERAKIIESMMEDMEVPWEDFISDVIDYLPYGYSVQEKVFRRRLKKNGSRFNDGLVGLRRISPRPQESIEKWEFSEDGRELLAVHQCINNLENGHLYQTLTTPEGLIRIPREKFMLFNADATRGNPLGNSILRSVFLSWKQLTLLKEKELLGIAKDAEGIPLIRIPAKFMADDADESEKKVFEHSKQIGTNLKNGTADCIVFPTFIDPESKKDLFDITLLERKGANTAGIDATIKRYQDEILSTLAVDILKSGNNEGSFSLADSTTNVLALAMEHRLNEIAKVLNHDLIPHLMVMNGWDCEVVPHFVFSDIADQSLDELGKFLQRASSVGLVEISRPVLNKVRVALGVQPAPDDEPVDKGNLTMASSNGGEGMKTAGEGTAKKPGAKDSSTQNSENAS